MSLVAKRTDEDHVGVHVFIGSQNVGESSRRNPVSVEVRVAEHNHKVFVGVLGDDGFDGVASRVQCVVSAQTELRVGVQRLSKNDGETS